MCFSSSHAGTESTQITPCPRSPCALAQNFKLRCQSQSRNRTTWSVPMGLKPVTWHPSALLFGWTRRPPLCQGRSHTIRHHFVMVSSGGRSFGVLSARAEYTVYSSLLCNIQQEGWMGKGPRAKEPAPLWYKVCRYQLKFTSRGTLEMLVSFPCSMPNRVHL